MNQQEFFNRYRYDLRKDKLGGGSFGSVYKAYDHVLDRNVAIKVSEVKYIGDKEFSLNEEFKAISKISHHPNIAFYEEVYTFESPQGIFDYAIMQLYKDGNLSEFIKTNPHIDFDKRSEIVLQIMNGVEHLHQNGLVHRDLKPGNIMIVVRENGDVVPKITDFGLSKHTDNNASRFQSSFAGGTIQYSSPEQIRGEEYKRNTDWWSFGVIAYEVFTGERLYNVSGISSASIEWQNQVSEQILKADIKPKLLNIPNQKWQQVVAACLEKEKSKRVQSATEIKLILNENPPTIIQTQEEPKPQTARQTVVTPKPPTNTTDENATVFKPIPTATNKSAKKSRKNSTYTLAGLVAVFFLVLSGIGFYYFFIKKEQPIETISLFQENNLYGFKKGDKTLIQP
ncbi:MAG: serine/threonine-protein kinase, partial [Flavobacteriaceae bacterium]|nr:serine/threonine-protein kinase [Flavobacteriaceae bacterium]